MNGSLRASPSVPTKRVIDTCSQRQDDLWFLTFRKAAGWAVHDRPIEPGQSVTVVNGRIV